MKSKFKFLITAFALFLMLFNSICLATDTNYETMLISDTSNNQELAPINSDLYITDSEYEINNTVNGNVFVLTDKFVLKSGCQINGDLYLCAKEVHLEQYSKIYGNAFICSNNVVLNAEINGSLYVATKNFDMQYNGFIDRDLILHAENATINGYIDRNSFIEAKSIATIDKFVNQGNFTIKDADNLTFSGEISGDATINAKNINFKNKDTDNNITCKISGKLSYSSKNEIDIPEGIVLKEVTYSNYINSASKNLLSSVWDYVLSLITSLICIYIIYLLISKFAPKYLDKISNISGLNLLKHLGIGLGFLILVPIVSVLLLISGIGSILGLILLFIYVILILIAKPIFIIWIARFAKNKLSDKINIYLYMLATTVILSLISLIPYVGFIVSLLINFTGFGMIIKNLMPSKK